MTSRLAATEDNMACTSVLDVTCPALRCTTCQCMRPQSPTPQSGAEHVPSPPCRSSRLMAATRQRHSRMRPATRHLPSLRLERATLRALIRKRSGRQARAWPSQPTDLSSERPCVGDLRLRSPPHEAWTSNRYPHVALEITLPMPSTPQSHEESLHSCLTRSPTDGAQGVATLAALAMASDGCHSPHGRCAKRASPPQNHRPPRQKSNNDGTRFMSPR